MGFPAAPADGQRYRGYVFKADLPGWDRDELSLDTGVAVRQSFEESTVVQWVPYADSGALPTDGTGGSPNVTAALQASNLSGSKDLILTKDAANRQGQGWSYDFTIEPSQTIAPVQVKCNYISSAAYAAGDVLAYIYDKTNPGLIAPSIVSVPATAAGKGSFSTAFLPSSSTSYRIIFHIATVNASAYTLELDDIVIGGLPVIQGAAISSPITFTPNANITNLPGSWTLARYARVGARADFEMIYSVSGSGTGTISFNLASLLAGLGLTQNGNGGWFPVTGESSGIKDFNGVWNTSNFFDLTGGSWGTTSPVTWKNADSIKLTFSVFIAQWQSNINMATDFTEYASNSQSSINTSDSTSFTQGSNGATILANTAFTYYDIQFTRSIQPSDILTLEVRSKIDGSWVDVAKAGVYSLFILNLAYAMLWNTGAGGVYYKGIGLFKVASNKVRIQFSNVMEAPSSFIATGGADVTWAAIIAATDGYDRWRVRKISNGNTAEQVTPGTLPITLATTVTVTPAQLLGADKIELSGNIGANATITLPITGVSRKFTLKIPAASLKASSANPYTLTFTTGLGTTAIIPISPSGDTISNNLLGTLYIDSVGNVDVDYKPISGSNSNGSYVKFADGTMICRGAIAPMVGGNVTTSSSLPAQFIWNTGYGTDNVSVSFSQVPVVTVGGSISVWVQSTNILVYNSQYANYLYWIVIGRWK